MIGRLPGGPADLCRAGLMADLYRGFSGGRAPSETPVGDLGTITLEDFAAGFAAAFKAG